MSARNVENEIDFRNEKSCGSAILGIRMSNKLMASTILSFRTRVPPSLYTSQKREYHPALQKQFWRRIYLYAAERGNPVLWTHPARHVRGVVMAVC